MANTNEPNSEKSDMRVMWIATGVIVFGIIGAMGLNMLVHHEPGAGNSTEMSSQSRAAPPK